VTQGDPGAAAVYRQNSEKHSPCRRPATGVTLTIERAYADVNRVMITYAVNPHSSTLIYSGFAGPQRQPAVSDSHGADLAGYDAYFQTDPQTNDSVGIIKYDAESIPATVRELALTVTVLRSAHGEPDRFQISPDPMTSISSFPCQLGNHNRWTERSPSTGSGSPSTGW